MRSAAWGANTSKSCQTPAIFIELERDKRRERQANRRTCHWLWRPWARPLAREERARPLATEERARLLVREDVMRGRPASLERNQYQYGYQYLSLIHI
eukprot:12634758-Heterocapsa_arctica.AAC.1